MPNERDVKLNNPENPSLGDLLAGFFYAREGRLKAQADLDHVTKLLSAKLRDPDAAKVGGANYLRRVVFDNHVVVYDFRSGAIESINDVTVVSR